MVCLVSPREKQKKGRGKGRVFLDIRVFELERKIGQRKEKVQNEILKLSQLKLGRGKKEL